MDFLAISCFLQDPAWVEVGFAKFRFGLTQKLSAQVTSRVITVLGGKPAACPVMNLTLRRHAMPVFPNGVYF